MSEKIGKSQGNDSKSGQMSVPVIVINDQIVLGFNQSRIDELLAKESPAR